jgi:hypothetical protein
MSIFENKAWRELQIVNSSSTMTYQAAPEPHSLLGWRAWLAVRSYMGADTAVDCLTTKTSSGPLAHENYSIQASRPPGSGTLSCQ